MRPFQNRPRRVRWGQIGRYFNAILLCGLFLGIYPSDVQSADDRTPHLYYFTNQGCAPCQQVKPSIERLKSEGYPVTTVNLAQNPDWGQHFQVTQVPTVIMVSDQRIVGRHAGLIDHTTLRQWFEAVDVNPGKQPSTFKDASKYVSNQVSSSVDRTSSSVDRTSGSVDRASNVVDVASKAHPPNRSSTATSTMHQGTPNPANEIEHRALQATVKLKIEDPLGTSYATGTVIHVHQGEWLVMTCGHAFREVGFNGKITGQYGFADGRPATASGELISYDAGPRDIALVALTTGTSTTPIKIAAKDRAVQNGEPVFSIGCDRGADPTIRHTQIKNRAIYDGSVKYDIHGRPAIGRSGGGLFNQRGELIGVCNAAAVDVDEGIYTAIDTLHWQLAHANLTHLFDTVRPVSLEGLQSASGGKAGRNAGQQQPLNRLQPGSPASSEPRTSPETEPPHPTPSVRIAQLNRQTADESIEHDSFDHEVIIIVRSKSNPKLGESITVSNPSPQLLSYLEQMKQADPIESRDTEMARWRTHRQAESDSGMQRLR